MPKKKIIFLVGPTASGKSATAVILAKKINAQIISCDSMQVYKHMDIVTAKITKNEMQGVKHHLIDIIEPNQEYNVAKFREKVIKLIQKIHKEEDIPLLVGGSGMYMQILLDGIFDDNKISFEVREKLNNEADEKGLEILYRRLVKLDPKASKVIHLNDRRRIIRALEVYYTLNEPITNAQKKRQGIWTEYNVYLYGFQIERKLLYEKINERVDEMFKKGLIEEIRNLSEKYTLSKSALGALGCKELFNYFKDVHDLVEAKRLIKRNTRRYAKKQMTWFNKENRIKWINVSSSDTAEKKAEKIYKDVKSKL
ncbi:MAG: tRNA (adenosine(37)-N6)-dimethylallyltransferase MiaA [Candidatus Kappaea frigidicola]|nr:tRNA (adenosine(37)-N6)-dimethylallyltransferase MiaA [Candidatus Kappaea frigidicola]